MKLNFIFYVLALPVVLMAGCAQSDIMKEVDFSITLDPDNTYIAGDPVTFNISGEVDNLTFYSGESGSRYEFKDRTTISMEDILSATLYLKMRPLYGNANGMTIYISSISDFSGLSGDDGDADRALVQSLVDGGMEGWTDITSQLFVGEDGEYEELSNTKDYEAYIDISELLDNFSIAFHWNPVATYDESAGTYGTQRTYGLHYNCQIILETENDGTIVSSLEDLIYVILYMTEELDPYEGHGGSENNMKIRTTDGYFQYFQGGNGYSYLMDAWLIFSPQPLNQVSPETGTVIKNLQNYLHSYSYTYEEAGDYEVTFVGANVNYLGSSTGIVSMPLSIKSSGTDSDSGSDSGSDSNE